MEVPLDDGSSSLRASFEQIKRLTAKGFNVESYSWKPALLDWYDLEVATFMLVGVGLDWNPVLRTIILNPQSSVSLGSHQSVFAVVIVDVKFLIVGSFVIIQN